MKPFYCQPLQEKTIESIEKKISDKADIVEIWLDHLEKIDFKDLKNLKKRVKKPFLYVCKSKREKGKFSGTEKARIEILANSEGDYIDVDIKTSAELITKLARKSKKLIISYHNFEKTPKNLTQIYKKMRAFKPDIMKFSTKINKSHDIGELFALIIRARKDSQPIITIGMGAKGKITRILAPRLGNCLYYAPIDARDASAPGQMTYDELNSYWK